MPSDLSFPEEKSDLESLLVALSHLVSERLGSLDPCFVVLVLRFCQLERE